jgi:release factor glutamine methyltransferase
MKIDQVRSRYREEALQQHINPRDVDLLLSDELSRPITFLLSHGEQSIDDIALDGFLEKLQRRFEGEPLQYIRGRSEFYGREFLVDRRAFIPRPETEFVVEAVLDHARCRGRVLDVGTGSGCIAVSIERERPDLRVAAIDVSLEALAVARANARRLEAKVRFLNSSLFSAVRGTFSVVVSNPPYVPEAEVAQLQREVRCFEPHTALTPGGDGLSVIDELLRAGIDHLEEKGFLIFEIGYRQVDAVNQRAEGLGWNIVDTRDDLAGIPRVIVLSR